MIANRTTATAHSLYQDPLGVIAVSTNTATGHYQFGGACIPAHSTTRSPEVGNGKPSGDSTTTTANALHVDAGNAVSRN